jgi:hypothetical protein
LGQISGSCSFQQDKDVDQARRSSISIAISIRDQIVFGFHWVRPELIINPSLTLGVGRD